MDEGLGGGWHLSSLFIFYLVLTCDGSPCSSIDSGRLDGGLGTFEEERLAQNYM